jgi:hypothetical protein
LDDIRIRWKRTFCLIALLKDKMPWIQKYVWPTLQLKSKKRSAMQGLLKYTINPVGPHAVTKSFPILTIR